MKRCAVLLLTFLVFSCSFGQLAPSAWPKYRSGGLNNGQSVGEGVSNRLLWQFQGQSPVKNSSRSPVIDVNGNVIFISTDGNLYCLSGATGSNVWTAALGSAYSSTPAIGESGYVYVGNDSGTIFAFDKLSGSQIWFNTISTGGPQPLGPPAISSDGTVYVECDDGNLYAIDGANGSIKWSFILDSSAVGYAAVSCPAVGNDGTIYLGGSNYLYALTSQGKVLWKYYQAASTDATSSAFSSPSIGPDGTIYSIYGGTGDFQNEGKLIALNGKSGAFLWNFSVGSNAEAPAISPGGTVFVNSVLGYVYAINGQTGLGLWYSNVHALAYTSIAIGADGTIYTMSNTSLVAINGSSGAKLWTSQGLSDGFSDPVIGSDGRLYVAGYGGNLFAFAGGIAPIAITVTPSTVVGGNIATGTVTINRQAPSDGALVNLVSSSPNVQVPASVLIPIGKTSTTFPVTTLAVKSDVSESIMGSLNGISVSTPINITAPILSSFVISPSTILGGQSTTGTLTISSPAPINGLVVSLSQTGYHVVTPVTVFIAQGTTSAIFNISTSTVLTAQSSSITASMGPVSITDPLSITPTLAPASLKINPTVVVGSSPAIGTVTLNFAAPSGGAVVSLTSDQSGVLVPATVAVLAGSTTASFTIQTPEVVSSFSANIKASLNGYSQSAALTLTPFAITSLSVAPSSVTGGTTSTVTINLNGPAPSGGLIVGLSSSSSVISVPGSITIPGGKSSSSFTVTAPAVNVQTSVVISAVLNGVAPQSATLTILPSTLVSVTLTPSSVTGGNVSVGTITLNGQAPLSGLYAQLSTKTAFITIPSTVEILPGNTSATFTVHTGVVSSVGVATITVSVGSITQSVNLTVNPSTVMSISLAPSTVVGGVSSTGTVTLTGPAPKAGVRVKLVSSLKSVTLPASVLVPAQKSSITFAVRTTAVATNSVAVITGSVGTTSVSDDLSITAPTLLSLTLNPTTVVGTHSSTGTVKISSAAPVGGLSITLASNNTNATVLTKVTIPAGRTSATFTVKTKKVTSSQTATISGTLAGQSASAILNIH